MDKVFTVSLSNPDNGAYTTLELPADPYAVLDAWERLRPAPDSRVEWEMEDYGEFPVLFPCLQAGEDLPALNTLAEKLAGLDAAHRIAFEGLVRLENGRSGDIPLSRFAALAEQAKHCHIVPEATDDASLGRFYAANGFIPEVADVPDQVFELLDFQLLGRRARQAEGGVFTRQGYVVPDGDWKPAQSQEPPAAPEAPAGIFRLELRLGEERRELTLPAGQELADVWRQIEAAGLPFPQPGAPDSGGVGSPGAAGFPEQPGHPADRAGGPGAAEAGQVQGSAGGLPALQPGGGPSPDGAAGRLQPGPLRRLPGGRGPRGTALRHR